MKALLAAALCLVEVSRAEVTAFLVRPSATDPEITKFDEPHWVYIDRDIVVAPQAGRPQPRHQLLLWLTGTGGKGQTGKGFSTLAAELGYHVITLMYPNHIPATACANDSDPASFEAFRMALIHGGSATIRNGRTPFSVARPDSIESRLIKVLQTLQKKRPKENWAQFLTADGAIKWHSIAVAGQSQGGGHAALIGLKHRVARAICFGAPKDYSKRHDAPAAWYSQKSATPKDRFFAFNHHQDPKGCTPEQLRENLKALGLDAFGPPAEVDSEPFPYRHARQLYTRHPAVTVTGVESEGAKAAHGSAISTRNAERWKPVWTYLLTE